MSSVTFVGVSDIVTDLSRSPLNPTRGKRPLPQMFIEIRLHLTEITKILKLDGLLSLVADSLHTNSATYTNIHPLTDTGPTEVRLVH